MKNLKVILFSMAIVALSISLSSCGSSDKSSGEAMEEVDKSGPEYASAYICPMHCKGSGSASEGKCPVCGMDYVANKDLKKDDHGHDGHDHGDHDGHNH